MHDVLAYVIMILIGFWTVVYIAWLSIYPDSKALAKPKTNKTKGKGKTRIIVIKKDE